MPSQSFSQALEYYRSQHRTKGCQLTHLFGVPMLAVSFPVMLFNLPRGLKLFAAGWVLQFIGHFCFEKNKPVLATQAASIWVPIAALVVVGQNWQKILYRLYWLAESNGQIKGIIDQD